VTLDLQPGETATERGDRVQREREAKVRPIIEKHCETMIRAAGFAARMSLMGYGPHVVTRDTDLPRELADWVNRGCKP
jgi:hypothetical protein